MNITEQLFISDSSGIGEARRLAVRIAEGLGFDEEQKGRVAIVANELGSNLIKHAKDGDFIISCHHSEGFAKLDLYVYDRGPGMQNLQLCMQDGFSTSGTVGGGLGAISRLPEFFDIYSKPEKGTAIHCSFQTGSAKRQTMKYGALNFPYPGELLSGDSYAAFSSARFSSFIVADGLGHGLQANEASQLAIKTFLDIVDDPPSTLMEKIHAALMRTRGAAVGIARIDHQNLEINFCGVGNIGAQVFRGDGIQSLMSHDGIVGQNARRFHSVTYPWSEDFILTLFSDGLSSRLRLDPETYPGLFKRSPQLIASVLMRDFKRGKDDATVLVACTDRSRSQSW